MAEIQKSPTTNAAQQSQQFIEFIMMQAQQAALCLGQIAHPSTGKAEVNLEAARMFIDHLEIIREKTRGYLSSDEEKILTSILSELQLAFVHVAGGGGVGEAHVHDENCHHDVPSVPAPEPSESTEASVSSTDSAPPAPSTSSAPPAPEEEGKKKFSKSYGS